MLRDPARLWQLMEEYERLCRLEGHSPQSRGQRLNGLIAEALTCLGIDATANVRSPGETDVVFTADGVRFVLEAKWEQDRANTGQIAKLQRRVQQRIIATYGVFLSMSGYSREALADVKDGQRLEVLLLDARPRSGGIPGHTLCALGGAVWPSRVTCKL